MAIENIVFDQTYQRSSELVPLVADQRAKILDSIDMDLLIRAKCTILAYQTVFDLISKDIPHELCTLDVWVVHGGKALSIPLYPVSPASRDPRFKVSVCCECDIGIAKGSIAVWTLSPECGASCEVRINHASRTGAPQSERRNIKPMTTTILRTTPSSDTHATIIYFASQVDPLPSRNSLAL